MKQIKIMCPCSKNKKSFTLPPLKKKKKNKKNLPMGGFFKKNLSSGRDKLNKFKFKKGITMVV